LENVTHKHSFIEFWKIPSDLVSIDDEKTDKIREQFIIKMPPQENQAKPALCQWGSAHFFAPVPVLKSKSNDISAAVKVDPNSCTVSLPFNIDQAVMYLLTEQYIQQETDHTIVCLARKLYYKLKPLLPRFMQIRVRQKAINRMRQRKFPTWELDTSVDLLHRNVLVKLLELNPGSSLPMISFWPQGADMCLVLTHDIETLAGIENVLKIINIEQKLGFRSVWNFVPERYPLDLDLLRELQASGFEIGVHGFCHDCRLFESYDIFQERAAKINEYLKQWGSVGFRSESNLRNLDWISKHIQTKYDTSCVSTEWYGAQPGGCCTVFPFIYRNLVELPITLQQDFTLLEILKLSPKETLNHWMNTVKSIRQINGLVLINVHPDYMKSPERLNLYENFLKTIKREMDFWNALPKEAAGWWLDRNNSVLSYEGGGWRINGPASNCGVVKEVHLQDGQLAFS
jgi:hypothetical protein